METLPSAPGPGFCPGQREVQVLGDAWGSWWPLCPDRLWLMAKGLEDWGTPAPGCTLYSAAPLCGDGVTEGLPGRDPVSHCRGRCCRGAQEAARGPGGAGPSGAAWEAEVWDLHWAVWLLCQTPCSWGPGHTGATGTGRAWPCDPSTAFPQSPGGPGLQHKGLWGGQPVTKELCKSPAPARGHRATGPEGQLCCPGPSVSAQVLSQRPGPAGGSRAELPGWAAPVPWDSCLPRPCGKSVPQRRRARCPGVHPLGQCQGHSALFLFSVAWWLVARS